jgi:hypothetical protein
MRGARTTAWTRIEASAPSAPEGMIQRRVRPQTPDIPGPTISRASGPFPPHADGARITKCATPALFVTIGAGFGRRNDLAVRPQAYHRLGGRPSCQLLRDIRSRLELLWPDEAMPATTGSPYLERSPVPGLNTMEEYEVAGLKPTIAPPLARFGFHTEINYLSPRVIPHGRAAGTLNIGDSGPRTKFRWGSTPSIAT